MIRLSAPLLLSAMAAALTTIAVACGGSGPAPTPTPTRTPLTEQEALNRSGAVMAGLSSFHFKMTHEVGTTEFLPGLNIEETSGDVKTPNALFAEFIGLFGEFPITAKLIAVDDANYMTNPLTGNWEEIDPTVSPIGFFNPRQGISSMMGDITEARFLDSNGGDDDTYEIAGRLPARSLKPLMGETVENGIVEVELSIDARSLHLKIARFIGQVLPSDRPDTVRVITLSGFNKPVDISAPDVP